MPGTSWSEHMLDRERGHPFVSRARGEALQRGLDDVVTLTCIEPEPAQSKQCVCLMQY